MGAPGTHVRRKTKETAQMEQKESFCFEVEGVFFFFFFPSLWSAIISVSLADAAVPVTEGDNIGAVFDWNKTRSMPICAANPISSSSDGMA